MIGYAAPFREPWEAAAPTVTVRASRRERTGEHVKRARISKEPSDGETELYNQPKCYGCGEILQTDDPSSLGYTSSEKYEIKKRHKQLDTLLCARCQGLSHGNMIPAVVDFQLQRQIVGASLSPSILGMKDERGAFTELLPSLSSDSEGCPSSASGSLFENIPVKALATPEELRRRLQGVRRKRALIVLLIDLLDASGSTLSRIRDLVGSNPVIAIGTKLDLLPSRVKHNDVKEWLQEFLAFKRINVVSTHVMSSKTKDGLADAVAAMRRERRGRDVYVIGAANVGKSAFIRALVSEMANIKSRQFDPAAISKAKYLPTESAMPGTTLRLIPLKVFASGGTLYDTPGLHLHHRTPHILTPEENKQLHPRRPLRGYVAPSSLEVLQSTSTDGHTHDSKDGISKVGDDLAISRGVDQLNTKAIYDGDRLFQSDTSAVDMFEASRTTIPAYWWSGLARLDVVEGASLGVQFEFFGPAVLRVFATLVSNKDEATASEDTKFCLEKQWNGTGDSIQTTISAPPEAAFGASSAIARGGYRCLKTFRIPVTHNSIGNDVAEISISGIPGWIKVRVTGPLSVDGTSERCRAAQTKWNVSTIAIRVWVPVGVETYLRPPIPSAP